MAQVVITTPEMLVTDDFNELTAVKWDLLVVDEAHRLKSHSSKLAVNLRDSRFVFHHTLLLTVSGSYTRVYRCLWVIGILACSYLNLPFIRVQLGNSYSK